MVQARTAVAFVATSLALATVARVASRGHAEELQAAVLADLVEEVRSGRANPHLSGRPLCVALWSTTRVLTRDGQRDPTGPVLAQLKALEPLVRPASACVTSEDGVLERATGRHAVLLSAGMPHWIDRDFARVEGAWYVAPLYAQGSDYTVSRSDGRWTVDTATFTWISDLDTCAVGTPSNNALQLTSGAARMGAARS